MHEINRSSEQDQAEYDRNLKLLCLTAFEQAFEFDQLKPHQQEQFMQRNGYYFTINKGIIGTDVGLVIDYERREIFTEAVTFSIGSSSVFNNQISYNIFWIPAISEEEIRLICQEPNLEPDLAYFTLGPEQVPELKLLLNSEQNYKKEQRKHVLTGRLASILSLRGV